jgi:hypothetical protein
VVDSLLEQRKLPTGAAPRGRRSTPDSDRPLFAASSSTPGSLDPKAASSREGCRCGLLYAGKPNRDLLPTSLPAEIRSAGLNRIDVSVEDDIVVDAG